MGKLHRHKYHMTLTDTETGELLFNRTDCSVVMFVTSNGITDIKCGELTDCSRLDYNSAVASLMNFARTLYVKLSKEDRAKVRKIIKLQTINLNHIENYD